MTDKDKEMTTVGGSARLQKLNETHYRAAVLLLQGGTAESIADALNVHPGTVACWKHSSLFKKHFRKLRRETHDESVAILQAASRQAVKVLIDTMKAGDPEMFCLDGRPDLALHAAKMVLDLSARWADFDVTDRVEQLERKAKKNHK